ncbi:GTP-binding protein, putative [Plasmodium vinckei]|uniref:GTP-binding protein, putative n=1 Tax=Plasmodium vinckei TaxID=5860 RepID=A0A6V7STB3_PLAVN|nr:GTP-binding protein, putative [Plasmodium vinckei]
MIFILKAILFANIYYNIVLSFHTKNNGNNYIYIKKNNNFKNFKSKKSKYMSKKCNTTFLCMNNEEQNDSLKKNKSGESLKFYEFSHIYKHLKTDQSNVDPEKKEKDENSQTSHESFVKNDFIKQVSEFYQEQQNNTKKYIEEDEKYTSSPDSDSVNNISSNILVKDEPNRIQKMGFENIYDYSSIFKEKEKKIHIKKYVANIFQKLPKFKDNLKVIKDALLYLKFIEKGNLYLVKDLDKKSINSEPYDDFSNKKKKKGTKKDKIKLELTSIYNNINKEKHTKKRICKECSIKVDLYTKLLSRPLNNIYNLHKNLKKYLHPFQYSLYENAITNMYKDGEASMPLNDVLNNIVEVRKLITVTGKAYAGQMKYLKTCREIFNKLNEAIVDLNVILQSGRKWLDLYNSYIKKIKKIKYIDIEKPAISIIGCTNVGKSSILNSITNSKSKIASYNFTTKEFNLGHYSFVNEDDIFTAQIMDLPGLINRQEEKRNIMEKLSLSSLKNIPSGVIYVFDPLKKEDHKFSSLKSQIEIRYYLRGLFPFRPWIDVITKSDLIDFSMVNLPKDLKENAIFISTEQKDSLLPLKEKINEMTFKLNNFLVKHTME